MARLSHRNILKVFDVAEDGDRVFLVMELARGGALWDRVIAKGPLHPRLAVELVAEVAEALAVAHEHGVVHRDIKPQNILLTSEGLPRLTDFGIAQVQDPVLQQALTRTGTVMGTWAFMAPEQRTSARQVDPRTDLYALAATLYALLKGTFRPTSSAAMDDRILEGIDEGAAAVIEMATRYRAEERHQTATELAAALRTLAASLPAIPEDSRSAALGVDPNAVSTPSFTPPSPPSAPPPPRSSGSQTRSRSRSADTHPSLEPFDTSAGRESSGTLAAFIDEGEPPVDAPARPTPIAEAAGERPLHLATRADPAMPARSPWRRPTAALALVGAVALFWWGSTGDPTVQAPTPPAGSHSAQPAPPAGTTPTAPERPPPPEAATDPADTPPPSSDAGELSASPPAAGAPAPTQGTPEPVAAATPEPAPTATPPEPPPDPSPDVSPPTPAPAEEPEPAAEPEPEAEPEPALVFVDGDARRSCCSGTPTASASPRVEASPRGNTPYWSASRGGARPRSAWGCGSGCFRVSARD